MNKLLEKNFSDIVYLGDVSNPNTYHPNYHNNEIDIRKHVRLYLGSKDDKQHLIAITPSEQYYANTVDAIEKLICDIGSAESLKTSLSQEMLIAAYNVAVHIKLISEKNEDNPNYKHGYGIVGQYL